jgi:hypothetical protein
MAVRRHGVFLNVGLGLAGLVFQFYKQAPVDLFQLHISDRCHLLYEVAEGAGSVIAF